MKLAPWIEVRLPVGTLLATAEAPRPVAAWHFVQNMWRPVNCVASREAVLLITIQMPYKTHRAFIKKKKSNFFFALLRME